MSSDDGPWIACRPSFFLPGRAIPPSRLFRRLFLHALQQAFDTASCNSSRQCEELRDPASFLASSKHGPLDQLGVYAKPPFGGAEQVVHYIGRYTHRVAISNSRIIDIDDGKVRFRWKDYRHGSQQKVMWEPRWPK
ncbi:transposase [Bradyrhizobium sp. 139]|nr:transposase [Bradyrhizobium sp. 139]